jgi:hypothetical protein
MAGYIPLVTALLALNTFTVFDGSYPFVLNLVLFGGVFHVICHPLAYFFTSPAEQRSNPAFRKHFYLMILMCTLTPLYWFICIAYFALFTLAEQNPIGQLVLHSAIWTISKMFEGASFLLACHVYCDQESNHILAMWVVNILSRGFAKYAVFFFCKDPLNRSSLHNCSLFGLRDV